VSLNFQLLHLCVLGDLKGVKCLKLETNLDLDEGDYDGRTALHLAASENHYTVVEYLLENGAKRVNPTDRWGNTPLDDAVRGAYLDVADLLKKHGGRSGKEVR
jgi:glutaminase